ncbi:hypothetical protein [Marinifilum caeruleilacunae]|uniref:Glycine zipper-like domain-containing protein n=1 Tax=Marinifilum caeruleilacunae TaxID=2499076 RepID=A0ABX1WQW5_9BACT|nr:hypothetical protein [Marinifilum caeruleilacunae]NOU58484.1 hypothetical protein [Marinifilum caeruleilacunae]
MNPKTSNTEEKNVKTGIPNRRLATGVSIGMIFGVAIGVAMDNIAAGIGIGMAVGATCGALSEHFGRKK